VVVVVVAAVVAVVLVTKGSRVVVGEGDVVAVKVVVIGDWETQAMTIIRQAGVHQAPAGGT
jgi:hypothetical protein